MGWEDHALEAFNVLERYDRFHLKCPVPSKFKKRKDGTPKN